MGCAGDKSVKKDPFFEKWDKMAKTNTGQSPAPIPKKMSMLEVEQKGESDSPEGRVVKPARRLPTGNISLKMRQADVKAVLRSLARIEGQNILVKNEVKGDVTVDFKNVPWDQAFNSILRNHGLNYAWEGDILRVMTSDDI